MKVFVFLGPTMKASVARKYLNATFLAPAVQGDVLRVMQEQPDVIAIIDGGFQFVPAPWHKEILTALESGVRVYGAASMGALRAAELHTFGMIGVGKIYQMYASGACDDDDEVAVTFAASAAAGYAPLSEAMVDIRDVCGAAVHRRVLDRPSAATIIGVSKSLYFPFRTWTNIDHEAQSSGVDSTTLARLRTFRASYGPTVKQRDAIQLLMRIAQTQHRRRSVPRDLRVQQSIFLTRARDACAPGLMADSGAPAGGAVDVARKKVLLAFLASKEAKRTGLDPSDDQIAGLTGWFRQQYGLHDDAVFDSWLVRHRLDDGAFDRGMQRFAAVLKMEAATREFLARETDEYLRLYGAAASHADGQPRWVQLNVTLNRSGNPQANARRLFGRLLATLSRVGLRQQRILFHFVRKPPDIRLRFHVGRRDQALMQSVRRVLADVGRRRCIEAVSESIYEPEWRQFGGSRGMAAVHEYFHADSMNWMRWDQIARSRRTYGAEQQAGAVLDDLFLHSVGSRAEVWDIWHNLEVLTAGSGASHAGVSAAPTLDDLAACGTPAERTVLRGYRISNRRLASALQRVRDEGDLTIGPRAILPFVAVFHCNRYGIDGTRQAAIAAAMVMASDPTRGFRS